MFCKFCFVKNYKTAREKIITDVETLYLELFGVVLTKLKNKHIYNIKLATDFLLQPRYIIGETSPLFYICVQFHSEQKTKKLNFHKIGENYTR
jgi:hypothetical protein